MLLDKVVIGSTLESAYYALINQLFFIPTRKDCPIFYKDGVRSWPSINIMLGLLSKRIAFKNTETIRVVENQIKISSENVTYKYTFDKCFIFDPTGVRVENKIKHNKQKTFMIYDDFELSVMGPKRYELEPIKGGSGFAKELNFYCSGRVDGSNYITDCVVESELTQDQLYHFDYSDSMVRFVVERHLQSLGVHGNFMKLYKSGKPKYRKPKVLHKSRLVYEKDNNVYVDSENVKFLDYSMEQIIEKSTKR